MSFTRTGPKTMQPTTQKQGLILRKIPIKEVAMKMVVENFALIKIN